MRRIVVTGAAGGVGTLLRPGLRGVADEIRLVDLKPVTAGDREVAMQGDVTDLAFARRALAGSEACVHLAAIPVEGTFDAILHSNIHGTWTVFEAARHEGCERIVFASSNHATGFYPIARHVSPRDPVKPDTYYGVSKVFGEALGSMYHDKFGLRVACIRIGGARPRPVDERDLSIWLSPGDLGRLVRACLTSPELGFAIVYGASRNTRGWWDLEPARRLGYEPQDDAEVFAEEVKKIPPFEFQGGDKFTGPGSTP
jgi:nucleoside-diphosphate-sugar epimerase